MLFNSVHFLLFFPLVVLLYYSLKPNLRWVLLLLASYYFYASWRAEYLILILFSTGIDYWCAIQMEAKAERKDRRPFLAISLVANLGLLAFFKYYTFANESLDALLGVAGIPYKYYRFEDLLLPVGISFYTFQTLSYSIEVYRGEQKAERNLGIFALYVAFFPQLVAGPIERFASLGEQLKQHFAFSWSNIRTGLQLMLYGFFIKICIADNLASLVDPFFAAPLNHTTLSAWIASVAYAFQIYCDFFGYSTIALGLARLLGIKIMDNFRSPYWSLSVTEFWKRWHISLSTWFRDYLYISLGGNRKGQGAWVRNILLVFLISGLWHGANWTFVVWGAIHALLYLIEKPFKIQYPNPVVKALMWFKTFIVVIVAWVFFRATDFGKAADVLTRLFSFGGTEQLSIEHSSVLLFAVFVISDIFFYHRRFNNWIDQKNVAIRWLVYAVMIFSILTLGGVENHPFIYFQF